ncbi:Chaperone ClpB [Cucumis melo var. makuwa]|uniref:Chaperone ClpB n=2 Tax=Cucumis melo TaxID=3656 RepID=A0A5D3DMB8_CUCMM|nr:Chaperone ClpB [Cucumis melo var. makuwa]TYK24738.1 Chaperone ClpB [Cucumis melo var. makuwa]
MWAASSTSPSPSFRRLPITTTPPPAAPVSLFYAKSHPPKMDAENTKPNNSGTIKSFGHKILSAVNSPTPQSLNQTTPKHESQPEAPQISGSDVLRALQKAAAVKEKNRTQQVKEKKKKKKEGAATEDSYSEMNHRVRPLKIKRDWGLRLTQLEKRLLEMSEPG